MKKILLSLLIIAFSLNAAVIKWEKEYASALKQSKSSTKPMMFIISNHNCHFCIQFENTTLKDPKVIQKLNADFVSTIVYVDENPLYPQQLFVGGTPGTWFLKSDGEPMFEPVMGAVDAETFLKALDIVKKEYAKNTSKK
ncbi:thioredoxin family protein [Sulfuricurvum sp.]|uniref:thioredoxin family protein n=1 Tax=Sulfuricurvum sp. TaxID=2025608 RepID=UPI0035696E45